MTRRFLSPGERQLLDQATDTERELLQAMFDDLDAHLVPDHEMPAKRAVEYRPSALWEEHRDDG